MAPAKAGAFLRENIMKMRLKMLCEMGMRMVALGLCTACLVACGTSNTGVTGEAQTEVTAEQETDGAVAEDNSGEETVVDDASDDAGQADGGEANAQTGENELPAESLPPLEIMELADINYTADNAFTCTYDGIGHDVIIDMPETVEGAPLVLMLHGYGQTAEGFRSTVLFHEVACPEGYAVAYVTGAPDSTAKTASTEWNSGMGLNENKDVEFLVSLVQYLEKEYKFDENRTYVAGFSNGAFMTHRVAIEAGDTFEAVISVAGMMPKAIWEERRRDMSAGVFQITGSKDDVVPKNSDGSAAHNPNPAIEEVIEYYATANGYVSGDVTASAETEDALAASEEVEYGKSVLKKYESDNGRPVWHLWVTDGRHSWPTPDIQKIDTNQLILEFLREN